MINFFTTFIFFQTNQELRECVCVCMREWPSYMKARTYTYIYIRERERIGREKG